MSDIDTFRDALDGGCQLKIVCDCGYDIAYSDRSTFKNAMRDGDVKFSTGGDWEWAFATDSFTVTCPSCGGRGDTAVLRSGGRQTIALKTEAFESTTDDGVDVYIAPNAPLSDRRTGFTELLDANPAVEIPCDCGHVAEYDHLREFEAAQGGLDPYALAGDSFEVTCPECGITGGDRAVAYRSHEGYLVSLSIDGGVACPSCSAPIADEGFKEGPGAPEVGWEYYECPDCGSCHRPEVVTL